MKNFLLLTLICVNGFVCAQISSEEQKIIEAIKLHKTSSVELLKKIVNINSGTMNFDGVKKVGSTLAEEFRSIGFEANMIPGDEFGRAGHLVASNNAKKGLKILLIGHLDTVFEPSSPFQSYSMLSDSIMRGPGVADMKGGDVIILLALRGLKEAGVLDKMNIEVIMTGDEESSGSPIELSKKALVDAAIRADVAMNFENADGDPKTIVTSRRGSLGWELQVTGNASHSSQIFTDDVGVGAIYESSRILSAFYEQLSTQENLTFNPGVILGGTAVSYDDSKSGGNAYGKSNVVAQDVVVTGDLRAVSTDQLNFAKNTMQKIIAENYNGTSAKLTFSDGGYPPMTPTEGNKLLLKIYSQISEQLGYGSVSAVNPRNAGAADISFAADHVDMAIDGLGLSGGDDHTINETGNLNMLTVQAERAAILMYRISRTGKK